MVRVKRRYLLCEVSYDNSSNRRTNNKKIDGQEFINAINNSVSLNFGDYGRSSTGKLSIVHLNEDSTTVMVQCKRAALNTVWASITFVTSISTVPLSINVIHVSGSIKKANVVLIEYRSKQLMKHELFLRGDSFTESNAFDFQIVNLNSGNYNTNNNNSNYNYTFYGSSDIVSKSDGGEGEESYEVEEMVF